MIYPASVLAVTITAATIDNALLCNLIAAWRGMS